MADDRDLPSEQEQRQAHQAVVVGNLLTGACRGLHESGFSVITIVLGLTTALEYFATVLINRAYHDKGDQGAAGAMQVIEQKLSDIRQTSAKMQASAGKVHQRARN